MQGKLFRFTPSRLALIAAIGVAIGGFESGCTVKDSGDPQSTGTGGTGSGSSQELSGSISIDGSSTVFPITQAVAEEFQKLYPRVRVTVGVKGTGGGFDRFTRGETEINDASRPIQPGEIEECRKNGIEFIELRVAIDGLSVIVNPSNDWCKRLTVGKLRKLWEPDSKVSQWNQLDPSWPKEGIRLYGPDTDSGTFDYFTEVICGKDGASRTDYTPSADDNVLVTGVSGDKSALAYFGYAYYADNKDKLKLVAVSPTDDPKDAVLPTADSIESGKYHPLSRPLFLYVNKAALKRPEVSAFLVYYLKEGQHLVPQVGYVPLSETIQTENLGKVLAASAGN